MLIASDGRALALLRQEFPQLPAFELPGYRIDYAGKHLIRSLLRQSPRILQAVLAEYTAVKKLAKQHRLDGVISDNRFGCQVEGLPSVFLTHQVNLLAPDPRLQHLARIANRFFINRFDECWIPDVAGQPNLSGILSHQETGEPLPAPRFRYVGALSRMANLTLDKRYEVIAVLSGPEPQRSILEKMILEQAAKMPWRFLVVLGKTEENRHFFLGNQVEIYSHLPSAALNEAIAASGVFIGRSGYSTIMDLLKTGIPAALIPTPGQTEQEYLAAHFHRQGIFLAQKQEAFNLKELIPQVPSPARIGDAFYDSAALEEGVNCLIRRT